MPAIFNIREITRKHTPLLEKMRDLIEKDLPLKMGIITNEEYDSGFRYKLFYSYYRYGDFFFITTKYLHTMSNIIDYSYNYKDSITLNELIYSSNINDNLGNPFWSTVKLNYNLRNHLIIDSMSDINPSNTLGYTRKQISTYRTSKNRNTSKLIKSKLIKNGDKSSRSIKSRIISGMKPIMEESKIILVYQESFGKYKIIYKNLEGEFWVLEIQNNFDDPDVHQYIMKNINSKNNTNTRERTRERNNIVKKLVYKCDYNEFNIYKFKKFIKLFKINRHSPLEKKDWKLVFVANPIVSLDIISRKGLESKTIDINDLFITNMITRKPNPILLPDITKLKPILIDNFINSRKYKNRNSPSENDCTKLEHETDIQKFDNATLLRGDTTFNCTHINPNNCGYNLIENIQPEQNKKPFELRKVIWVLPDKDSKYLKNFTSLDDTSLEMLKTIYKLYIDCSNCNNQCFLHLTITLMFNCLHFHIVNYDTYIRKIYPTNEFGSIILKEINIHTLINFISTYPNYYTNSNFSYLRPL